MTRVDPYAVLGVRPGSSEREVAAAYKELAKRFHPDRGGGEEGERRMSEINVAYERLRGDAGSPRPVSDGPDQPDPLRRALGAELRQALGHDETVELVTPTSTWASPHAILVLTNRRLLWLLDDAPVARVRSLALRDVAAVDVRRRRRRATLAVRTLAGRRHAFHDLRPHTAATIARQVRPA
jgi:DnaJ domain